MNKISLAEINQNTAKAFELQGSLLMSKNLTVKQTGIDSKTFHYWKMNGLLGTIEEGKWARISFIEYVWIKTLKCLRDYGCSLQLMKNIFKAQFLDAYEANLYKKIVQDNLAYYYNLKKIRKLDEQEVELMQVIEKVNKDPLLMSALRTEVSHFSGLILTCLNAGLETGFIVYQDESFAVMDGTNKSFDFNQPYLFIPLSHFITEILLEEDKAEFVENTGVLNEDEMWVLTQLRKKNIQKISITIDHKSGKYVKIECEQNGHVDGSKAKEIMKLLGLQNYESIELSTRTGTSLSFTKTHKRYFK